MGLIILFVVISTIIVLSVVITVAVSDSSDSDNNVFAFVVAMFFTYSVCRSFYRCNIFIC